MRRIVVILLLIIISLSASAQRPWVALSAEEQSAVLTSRRTPSVVRRVMTSEIPLSEIDAESREELLRRIVSRTKDEHLAALYVYLYDVLRSPDGSMRRSDVRMLAMHTEAMLAQWSSQEDRRMLYNYAYSIGRSRALGGGSSVKSALRKMTKKRIFEKYLDIVALFDRAQNIAYESISAGARTFEDVTPTVKAEDILLLSSAEEYSEERVSLKPVAAALEDPRNEAERSMREECMAWSRSYHTFLEHPFGRNLTLVRSTRNDGEYLTFIDPSDDSYTVVNEVYILDSGCFVVVERGEKPQSLILGRIAQRGSVEIIGKVYIDMGREIIDVRCTLTALHLHLKGVGGKGEEYLKLPLK